MSGLASCAGCGKVEPGDDLVESIVVDLSPPGEPLTEAVVARCAAALSARIDAERTNYFAPARLYPAWSRQTAEHEAGHAIVGLWFGAVVEVVNIDSSASCHFADLDALAPLQRVLVNLAGHAAGGAAEPLDLGFCTRMARADAPKTCDRCKAVRGVAGTMPDGSDAEWLGAYRAMEDRVARLVRYRPVREAIDRVADALVERGHLSGAEVEALAGPEIMRGRT